MTAKKSPLRRRWISIKNDFKRSWDKVSNEDPENFEDDIIDFEKFNSIDYLDYDEGFKRPRNSLDSLLSEY